MADPPLLERLRKRIRAAGPMTFAEFMEAALYDPREGFYARARVGERGDFVTSPHVSSVYGQLVARQVAEFFEFLGRPPDFAVVEVGAGDGTLARSILSSLPTDVSGAVRYIAVERSEGGLEQLGTRGLDRRASLEDLAPVEVGCLLANELLDNLPFHWVRGSGRGPVEVRVGLDPKGGLAYVEGEISSPDVLELASGLRMGEQAVVSPAALAFLRDAVRALRKGYVWLADYGFVGGARADEPHGYRGHRPAGDLLAEPGSRDITAGVDFDALVCEAYRLGLTVWPPVPQRNALLNLGFREVAEEARARQVQAISARKGIDALRIYSERTRANLLLAHDGLGDFLVLCLGVGIDRPPRSVGGKASG